MTTEHRERSAYWAMYAGLGLTIAALTRLPSLLGWAGMFPCLAGPLSVTLLWRSR